MSDTPAKTASKKPAKKSAAPKRRGPRGASAKATEPAEVKAKIVAPLAKTPRPPAPLADPVVRVKSKLKMNPFVIPLYGEGGEPEGSLTLGKKGSPASISAPFSKKLIQTSPHLLAALEKKQVDLLE